MNISLIYITASSQKEAMKISKHLLTKKLATCTNSFPISSCYWWKGKVVNDKEWVVIAKTKGNNYEKIKKEVGKIHSYEVPCIVQLPSKVNKDYYNWLINEVK